MDPYLMALIYFNITAGSIILLFLTLIIIMRLSAAGKEKKYKRLERKWEALFLWFILNDGPFHEVAGKLKKSRNYHFFKRFFTPYLETLDGVDFEATKALCREISLIAFYQHRLTRGSMYQKALAARFLGVVRCRESIRERMRLLKSKNKLLVLASAQGLVVSEDLGTFRPVMKALLRQTHTTYEGVTEILSRYGREICLPITNMLDTYSRRIEGGTAKYLQNRRGQTGLENSEDTSVALIIMVDLLGHYQYREALSILNRLLVMSDVEKIIHIMKAFLRIGELPCDFDPKPYLEHDDWVVRNFATQVTALSQDMEAVPILNQLLEDEQWWVRYNAANALINLGERGRNLLTSRANDPDSRVSGIASYILEAKGAGR